MLRAVASEIYSYIPTYAKFLLAAFILIFTVIFFKDHILLAISVREDHIKSSQPTIIDRLRASKEYMRYSYRSFMYDGHNSESPPIMRHRAVLLGIDKAGSVHLSVYTMNGKTRVTGRIADIELISLNDVSSTIKREVGQKSVVIDTYRVGEINHFVIWLNDGSPLNEVLINLGLATPISTPPTNIVNSVFKNHYKRILAGGDD